MIPSTTQAYTIKKIGPEDITTHLCNFIWDGSVTINERLKFKNWEGTHLAWLAIEHLFLVAYKGKEPVGFLIATLGPSVFGFTTKVLRQEILYAKPGTRAAYLLLQEFIDFGRTNANHIITMIGEQTNIKPQSLEKLGFVRLEELYRLEV